MKKKRIWGFVIILSLCYCLFLLRNNETNLFFNKITIIFLLVVGAVVLISKILFSYINKAIFFQHKHTKIIKSKKHKKTSNNEIIKLIEDYNKNKGEENDNK